MIETIENIFSTKDKKHAIDIGANIGFMTAYFGSKWDKVTSFEPTPYIFECLQQNCNKPNIDLYNLALSNREEDMLLAVTGKSEINQIVSSENVLNKHWKTISIPCKKLDSFNLENVDLIKIDVEGHELSVVKGAEKTIKKFNPLIVIEISFENKVLDKNINQNHEYALTLLESWGYKIIKNYNFDWILKHESN